MERRKMKEVTFQATVILEFYSKCKLEGPAAGNSLSKQVL